MSLSAKSVIKSELQLRLKGKGKRGGGRVITNIVIDKKNVYLLSVYDKSEKDDLSDEELEKLLEQIS